MNQWNIADLSLYDENNLVKLRTCKNCPKNNSKKQKSDRKYDKENTCGIEGIV
jgi:hypothetical protein